MLRPGAAPAASTGAGPSIVHDIIACMHLSLSGQRRKLTRGSSKRPVVDQTMVYGWIELYRRAVAGVPAGVCAAVAAKYESQVAQYGCVWVQWRRHPHRRSYSLHNFKSLTMTKALEDFILAPLRPQYA